jgi:thioesterase domain-containing protein
MSEFDLEAINERIHRILPITTAMGLRIVEVRQGYAAAEIPLAPNSNHFGAMYAGSLFAVAEVLGGVLSRNCFGLDDYVVLAKTLAISFLRPGTTAVRSAASMTTEEITRVREEALANGKADFRLATELTDEAGTVVARTEALYQMRKLG